MNITIKFLKPFSDAVGKKNLHLDFKGNTLEDLLQHLINTYPLLKKELYNDQDEIADYFYVFVNDKPISALQGFQTKLQDNDELVFLVPVSGG